ncbi:MAG: hypothetical protein DCE90_18830 [Pseudanabaena sp.]|nr:MAG: hypothetical protein DCE90_18830 [Pseudanabaena sp.]
MNHFKSEARLNSNIDTSNYVVDLSTGAGFHSHHGSQQQPIQPSLNQSLIDESKYLIAEAKKLMSNRKVIYFPHELINDSKCLTAHAEKILNNCKTTHR